MKSFYFFRHGETDWNKKRLCQGQTDIELNQQGIAQARSLAQFFEKIQLDVIYSSDLVRALKTAQFVAQEKTAIITTERLRETNLGEIEGKHIDQAREIISDDVWWSFNRRDQESLKLSFPGGETRKQVLYRFLSLVSEAYQSEFSHIGISTHGGAMRNFLHFFLPENTEALKISNCIVYILEIESLKDLNSYRGKIKGPYHC